MQCFYINGKRVARKLAFKHWKASMTYRNAKKTTRDSIWRTAVDGDEGGNHNPHGEVEHLLEAGIELK